MLTHNILVVLATLSLTTLINAFSANGNNNVALYWGQNSNGQQQSLGLTCQNSAADIVILSFLNGFPKLIMNFANACETVGSDGVLHCPQIAEDIKTCQSLGKKVLLSLGGASGAYGFTSNSEAQELGTTLWNKFGGGTDANRPFDDAIVDGFDFDIENGNPTGYAALATSLRSYFNADSSRSFYLSAAPQCPYPDASVGDALAHVGFDFAFIQFYNNYCSLDQQFNWNTWTEYASTAPNKNIKLYVGLAGAPAAAGSGYVSPAYVKKALSSSILNSPNFGGISLWDAASGLSNTADGTDFVQAMKNIVNGASPVAPVVSSVAPVVSSVAPVASSSVSIPASVFSSTTPTYTDVSSLVAPSSIASTSVNSPVTSERSTSYTTVTNWPSVSLVSPSTALIIPTSDTQSVSFTPSTSWPGSTTLKTQYITAPRLTVYTTAFVTATTIVPEVTATGSPPVFSQILGWLGN